jgi:hypothetical protein
MLIAKNKRDTIEPAPLINDINPVDIFNLLLLVAKKI